MQRIKYLFMDVDGTLTDGKIYMGMDGEICKRFDIKDGYGIGVILPEHGITPVIITARESKILQNRCRELGITELQQHVSDKLECMKTILSTHCSEASQAAYIGDDIPDLQCMMAIKEAGGLVGCPSDAADEIKAVADYVCKIRGGDGAVREFIEWLVRDAMP